MTAALPHHECLLRVKLGDDNFSCLISPHPPVTQKRKSIIMPISQRRKLRQQGRSETATVTSAGAPKDSRWVQGSGFSKSSLVAHM